MKVLSDTERRRAAALASLSYCNPFLPERIEYERLILGDEFVESDQAWHKRSEEEAHRPNIDLLTRCSQRLADRMRKRLNDGMSPDDEECALYEDVVLYFLYNKYEASFLDFIIDAHAARKGESGQLQTNPPIPFYSEFQDDMVHFFAVPGLTFSLDEADHLFACFFQLRRAFHHIYDNVIGGSMVSARLRAAIWQSIFTFDMRRYRRGLYKRMGDVTTLVTGPSGTGKELVARAIGLSRYIPFDAKPSRFTAHFMDCFYPLNLSALSPTLIESELFGHTKGSFTGAVADRVGYFEECPADGTVFLDEIGELDPAIQVKLLRVLHTRTFQRIGDPTSRRFLGKVVAATNRDLVKEMQERRFREDLYYRLCSDMIVTPSLRDQLIDSPEQLRNLLRYVARHVAGEHEAEALAREVEEWIVAHLGPGYPWPGNVRELEQCVRNVLVHSTYRPPEQKAPGPIETFLDAVEAGRLTADDLLRHYCSLLYAQTGSYREAAHRLELDRRTVKSRVDPTLVARFGANRMP